MINCSICNSEIEEENGDIVGYFGDMEVSFCIWCLSISLSFSGFDSTGPKFSRTMARIFSGILYLIFYS